MTKEMYDVLSYMREALEKVDENIKNLNEKYKFEYPIIAVVDKGEFRQEYSRYDRYHSHKDEQEEKTREYRHSVLCILDEEFSKEIIQAYKQLDSFVLSEQKKDLMEKYIMQAKLNK